MNLAPGLDDALLDAPAIVTTVEIRRTPEQVFDRVANPSLWHTWHPATRAVRRLEARWTGLRCGRPARWEIGTDTGRLQLRALPALSFTPLALALAGPQPHAVDTAAPVAAGPCEPAARSRSTVIPPAHVSNPPAGPAANWTTRLAARLSVRPRSLSALAAVLGVAAVCWAALVGALYLWQERLLFQPLPLPQSYPFAYGSDVREVSVDVPGARLNALHLTLPRPRGLVFFLHGNAGNLASWFTNADFYRRANVDLFMLDYRGYGKSTGRIESEAQLRDDVRAAWRAVAPRYAGLARVIYGRSLGTALAAGLAAEVQPELTILVSPYRSMQALAGEHYPWVPVAALRYPLRTEDAAARIRGPVWLVHGELDSLIDVQHSHAIRERVPQAKLLVVPGAGHNDLQRFDAYTNALRDMLVRL